MFQDQLDTARANFDKLQQAKGFAAIDSSQLFVGPNAFHEIAASREVDAIVVATPPYFHPQHLEAVVAAGKHVYLEKPVAVDVPGAKRVIEIGQRAEGRLSLDVGFQIRDCPPFVEMVRRIHAGAVGKIACGEAYYLTGYIDRPAWPTASPAERRLRNWIYDRALSGDIIVEQNIHVIDIRSEEHTSELQSRLHLVCRLLLEKKKTNTLMLEWPDSHPQVGDPLLWPECAYSHLYFDRITRQLLTLSSALTLFYLSLFLTCVCV